MKNGKDIMKLIVEAVIMTVAPLIISTLLQSVTSESICVNVAPSFKIQEDYITAITVQNKKNKTLSDVSLYLDFDLVNIESDDFNVEDSSYIKLQQLSPNQKYGAILHSIEPVSSGNIIVETDCKYYISYSEEDTSFWGRTVRWLIIYGGILFITTIIQLSGNYYLHKKDSHRLTEKITILKAEIKENRDQLSKFENEVTKHENEIIRQNKRIVQIRVYYTAHISDLRKELAFWKDTIRKILYQCHEGPQVAENIIDTVTSTLKTYTVRCSNENNFDEIMYIAEHLSNDSKDKADKESS